MSAESTARFFKYIQKGDTCWLWKGSTLRNGYGRFFYKYREELAHRVAYEIAFGEFPRNLQVMHLCHNRGCVNPEHLKLGTIQENLAHNGHSGKIRVDNTTGISGVSLKGGMWRARYVEYGKETVLYYGPNFFEACCARKSWESQKMQAYI